MEFYHQKATAQPAHAAQEWDLTMCCTRVLCFSSSSHCHRLTPTVPSQHFSYRTHWCQHRAAIIPVCHRSSPAPCKFSTSLFQNQRQHLLPGISKWQKDKIVLGLLQASKWCVCTSDTCGRREKGKDQKKRVGERWGDRSLRHRREGDIAV